MTKAPSELSDLDLREGFASFVEAAQRLEQSYAVLKARAEAIDLELDRTNQRLASTLEERETVFHALPVGVVARDPEATRWCNPEAERLLDAGSRAGVDLLAAAAGEVLCDRLTIRLTRVGLPAGGELIVLEDRSRLVELETEVRRLDRIAGLSELALGIAHEIKNPLNGVIGFASLMEQSDDPETLCRYGRKVAEGLHQVDDIVKAMLAFARPSGKERALVTVKQVISEAAMQVGVPTTAIRMRGELEATIDGPAMVRVLGNLFRNAVDAKRDAGGSAVCIDLDVRREDRAIVFEVRDDGPGVDAELGLSVFEPFVSSKESGHGLGLAVATRVLSFLGGSITLQNPGVVGAHFVITVPCVTGVEP